MQLGGWWWLALALTFGCDDHTQREQEAARILRAVEGLRAAARPDRVKMLAELQSTKCTEKELCQVKSTCAAAYQRLVQADELTAAAQRLIDRDPHAAASKTAAAEKLLSGVKPQLTRCVDLHAAQRRRYGR